MRRGNCVKAKITGKKIISKMIMIIIILAVLYLAYCTLWRVDIGTNIYLINYRDYYYATKVVHKNSIIYGAVHRQIIYIKIGQKGKMLNKIKEDVINSLETMIKEHGDIFYKYEISDDFKRICVYEVSEDVYNNRRDEVGRRLDGIRSLMGLHHSIKNPNDVSMFGDYVLDIIKPGD